MIVPLPAASSYYCSLTEMPKRQLSCVASEPGGGHQSPLKMARIPSGGQDPLKMARIPSGGQDPLKVARMVVGEAGLAREG